MKWIWSEDEVKVKWSVINTFIEIYLWLLFRQIIYILSCLLILLHTLHIILSLVGCGIIVSHLLILVSQLLVHHGRPIFPTRYIGFWSHFPHYRMLVPPWFHLDLATPHCNIEISYHFLGCAFISTDVLKIILMR